MFLRTIFTTVTTALCSGHHPGGSSQKNRVPKPFEATEETPSETDCIEPVVKAQWCKLESKICEDGTRSYSLLDEHVLLFVNHMVFSGLKFSMGKGRPKGREIRCESCAKPLNPFKHSGML